MFLLPVPLLSVGLSGDLIPFPVHCRRSGSQVTCRCHPVTRRCHEVIVWEEDGHILGHNAVIKWKHFPRFWPFVRGIHRSPVNSPHKGQWRGALMFSLICAWINSWVNNRKAGHLRCHLSHYDVTVMGHKFKNMFIPLSGRILYLGLVASI